MNETKPTRGTPRLRGGLIAPDAGHMPTLFTLIIAWALLTMSATVLVPYFLHMRTDSIWTDGGQILFWSIVCLVSTGGGILGYILGYRKGGEVKNFFIGTSPFFFVVANEIAGSSFGYEARPISRILAFLLTPAAVLTVGLRTRSRPDRYPERPKGLVRALDRAAYAMGNVWWGIGQLVIILVVLIRATVYETEVGGPLGNEAAYAAYYNTWWFGLFFLVFFLTLYCATMRKYPFRISQIGWLTTHTGLLLLLIGCMIMYWGSWSGSMQILEGETENVALSHHDRRLEVSIPSLEYRGSFHIEIDKDPEVSDVHQVIPVVVTRNGVREEFRFTIDRYLSRARRFRRIEERRTPGPDGPTAGAEVRVSAPGFDRSVPLLEGDPNLGRYDLPNFSLRIQTVSSDVFLEGLGHAYDPNDPARGELSITAGEERIVRPIEPLPLADGVNGARGRGVKDPAFEVAGVSVEVVRYFDRCAADGEGEWYDAFPGTPQYPGVEVLIGNEKRSARYVLLCTGEVKSIEGPEPTQFGLDIEYRTTPALPVRPGTVMIAVGPGDVRTMVICDTSGTVRKEPLEIGRAYRFSESAPIRITPENVVADAEFAEGIEKSDERNPFRAIHMIASGGGDVAALWLGTDPEVVSLGRHRVQLRYRAREKAFPFDISVLDFRQTNYSNSTKPEAFETNIVVRDHETGEEFTTLVDMNHPLRYGGYRFFNGSPIEHEQMQVRGIVFTVGRNPGYGIIVLGSFVTTLGIVLVLFFKPRLRRWETERRRAPQGA